MKINKMVAISSVLLMSACAYPLTSAGPGFVYTKTTEGITVDNTQRITKHGQACSENILGLVTYGDSSIEQAKKDGKIKNVAVMNRDYFGILSVYSKSCLLVKGN